MFLSSIAVFCLRMSPMASTDSSISFEMTRKLQNTFDGFKFHVKQKKLKQDHALRQFFRGLKNGRHKSTAANFYSPESSLPNCLS